MTIPLLTNFVHLLIETGFFARPDMQFCRERAQFFVIFCSMHKMWSSHCLRLRNNTEITLVRLIAYWQRV